MAGPIVVLIGVWRNAPHRRLPWCFLAAAMLFGTLGDFGYGLRGLTFPAPLLAELCYAAMMPLAIMGLVMLVPVRAVLVDRTRLLDLLGPICAVLLLLWVYVADSLLTIIKAHRLNLPMIAAFAVGDLLYLVIAVVLLLVVRVTWTVVLLVIGAVANAVGDGLYLLQAAAGSWSHGGPDELAYVLLYGAWGAAALHPSMVELTRRDRPMANTRIRNVVVPLSRISLAVPAVVLAAETLLGRHDDALTIALVFVVMGELVVTRLADSIERHRRAVTRERGLRESCGRLVAALDSAEVAIAVRGAVRRLMPPGSVHRVAVLIGDELSAGFESLPAPDADRRTRLVPARILHPVLREPLGSSRTALVGLLHSGRCAETSAGEPGVLLIAADDWALRLARDAIEVLVAQTAMALERISLSGVLNRRDGDRYLRTVVRNTSDVVLIVDSDYRVRYASPSLAAALGVIPSANATLLDLVDPADHEEISRVMELAGRSADQSGVRGTWRLRRTDGAGVLVEARVRDLRGDRMVRGYVVTMRDVTERRDRERESIRRALRRSGGWQNRERSLNRYR